MDQFEVAKVYRKVPKWFTKPKQINTRILLAFLDLSKNGKYIEIKSVEEKCKEITTFNENLAQLCCYGKKNNAKIFKKQNGLIKLEDEICQFILDCYSEYKKVCQK